MICNRKKLKPGWNNMEELKYLICAIDSCKCPRASLPSTLSIILPPRVEEIPCETQPPRRLPCVPPPRCCPITPGPCCPYPSLPPTPPIMLTQPPLQRPPKFYCHSPLPCYPTYCK